MSHTRITTYVNIEELENEILEKYNTQKRYRKEYLKMRIKQLQYTLQEIERY